MKSRIKILFILPSLHSGGAERVVSFLAQNLDKNHFESQLLILYNPQKTDYKIEGVPCHFLKESRSLKAIPGIIKAIKRFKPDFVFTSINHLNLVGGLLQMFYRKTRFIGREASVFSERKKYSSKTNFFQKILTRYAYKKLFVIICATDDIVKDLHQYLGVEEKDLIKIGNPIHFSVNPDEMEKQKNQVPQLITVGRLVKLKGYDRILDVLRKLEFEFHYTIIGNGVERENLMSKIQKLELQDKVSHIPYTDKVEDHLIKSDLFLQASYVEGFGMALLENFALGVPAVVFNAPGGPKELVVEGINGFIVDTSLQFKDKIEYSLFEKKWNKEQIIQSVTKKFAPENILSQYEHFFKSNI